MEREMLLLEEYLSFHLPRSVSCRDTTRFCCELSPSPSSYSTVASYHNSVLFNMETSYSCDAREDPDESIESIEDIIPHRENKRRRTRDDIKKKREALLEVRIEQIAMEAELGQQRAKCSEELTLDQEIASNEVEPGKWMTRLVQWGKQYNDDDDVQFYGVREECILLLSCKHMCLCKECERKLSYCLLCQSSKFLGIVIYTRRVHALAGTVETGKWMTRLL
ncbi:hypothetical protein HID58_001787, partial [Brassica napus]